MVVIRYEDIDPGTYTVCILKDKVQAIKISQQMQEGWDECGSIEDEEKAMKAFDDFQMNLLKFTRLDLESYEAEFYVDDAPYVPDLQEKLETILDDS